MFKNPFDEFSHELTPEEQTASSENETEQSLDNDHMHYVHPHYVEGYERDGQYIEGYWRDGDGDTSIDRSAEDDGGYLQSDPDDDTSNNLG